MLLTMYKVGFGDCFKFEETTTETIINNTGSVECEKQITHKMLVDCGSKNADLPCFGKFEDFVKVIYHDIFYSPDNEQIKRCALLTHFHEDHYKGFLQLSDILKNDENKFDKFYVPYIAWESEEAFVFVKAALYLYYLGSKQEESSFFLFEQLQMLKNSVRNLRDICCLKRDDAFKLGNIQFKVLWPEFPQGTQAREIENWLAKIDEEIETKKELHELANKFVNNLRKFYELISNSSKERADDNVKYAEKIIENQKENVTLLKAYKKELKGKNSNLKLMIKDLKDLFKEGQNATSIVFCDSNHQLIMMGDVTSNIIDSHLFKGNWEYIKLKDIIFSYLKAPHHGTRSHYTINIPATENILISTGRFGSYGKISEEYYEHRLSEGKKICSSGNDWCHVIEKGKRCSNCLSKCEISGIFEEDIKL